jgi:hypothetical protein
MDKGRRAGAVLFGLLAGGWFGRAVFDWLIDVGGDLELALIGVCAVIGAGLGAVAEEQTADS